MKKTYAHIAFNKSCLTVVFLCFQMIAQNNIFAQRANNWYFFHRSGINFNTVPPSVLFDGQSDNPGSASMSDNNGQLLFYSDATQIWNRQQQLMPNGTGLWGGGSQIASNYSTTIPFPNDSNKYYLFLAESFSQPPSGYSSYNYSVVDMRSNGGLGDIALKNQLIARPSGERMTTVQAANGIESWFISLERGNLIYNTFKIGCSGFSAIPIRDTFEQRSSSDSLYYFSFGDMKSSLQNNKICVSFEKWIDLYQFNNHSGHISSRVKLHLIEEGLFNRFYDFAFSKNGKYLYNVERIDSPFVVNFSICRYNLTSWDSATIKNSREVIYHPLNSGLAYLQLGPDDNIYFNSNLGAGRIENSDSPNPIFFTDILDFSSTSPSNAVGPFPKFASNLISNLNVQIPTYSVAANCRTVTLTAKTYIQGRNLAFKWKFGDGDSSIQNVVSGGDTTYTTIVHTYPLVAGIDTFFVSLTVISDTVCGLGRAGAKVVVKPPPPVARFGFGNIGCGNGTVQFTDSSLLNANPSLTYQWSYKPAASVAGFFNFSALQNPAFSFPALDSFSVRLIVTSALACVAADTIVKNIVLKAKPVAGFTFAGSCGSKTISFTNNSTVAVDTLSSYQWNFNNEGNSSAPSPPFTFSNFGNKTVSLQVVSSVGCASEAFWLPVTVSDKPLSSLSVSGSTCANTLFTIAASNALNNASIVNHTWLVNNLPVNNNSAVLAQNNPAGNYQVKYIALSSQGCAGETAIKNIVVDAIPVAAFTVQDGCAEKNIVLQNNSSAAAIFSWQFGNADTLAGTLPVYAYNTAGRFFIRLQASSANGCKASSSSPVLIESIPTVDFNYGDVCVGKRILFSNNSSNALGNIINYQWNFDNDSTASSRDAATTFNNTGNYRVRLSASTANGCSNSRVKNIILSEVAADAGNNVSVLQNSPYTLQGSGGVRYEWRPSELLNNPALPNPVAVLQNDQIFRLYVTTAQGCKGYDSVFIKVLGNIFIPKAFAPGGINKFWRIKRLEDYESAKLALYNRYGQKIFEGSPANGYAWDGNYKGKPQPAGAYLYVLAVDDGKRKQDFKGTVVLVR